MVKLPVIVGFGGINAAGRSSGSHSYKRMVCEALSATKMEPTWQDLAHRMGLATESTPSEETIATIKDGTLIRRIQNFDPDRVPCHHKAQFEPGDNPAQIHLKHHKLSKELEAQATITELPDSMVAANFHTPLPITDGI
jgi:acetoacetyl-[acyl-carrier protein] synthase